MMDRRADNRNRRMRPIPRRQKQNASTNELPPVNASINPPINASSRNIIATNFRGNSDSNKMLMCRLGLDDARNYIELKTSDCFIQEIDDLLYCALCFQKFSPLEDYQRNGQSSRISSQNSGQRNAHFPRLSSSDNSPGSIQLPRHHDEKHLEAFAQLLSKLRLTTPGLNTMNMMALRELLTQWLDDNWITKRQITDRYEAIEDFKMILNEVDPQCQFRVIGSLATAITLPSSDVNIELVHPNNKLFEKDPRAKNSIHHKLVDPGAEYGYQINNHTMHYDLIANAVDTLYKVAKRVEHNYLSIRSFKLVRRHFCSELSSKTPKLVLKHQPTEVTLEILCYADTRHLMDCLIKNYESMDLRLYELAILVKHWAKECRISNPADGTLSPQALVILVIHFLQRTKPPVLPCLHEMLIRNDDKPRKKDDDAYESVDNELVFDRDVSPKEGTIEHSGTVEDADIEVEDDTGEEIIVQPFDQGMIDSLNWSSSNTDSNHKLFVDFLRFFMDEFSDTSTVISILTLKKVTINDKRWKTQLKAIENPIKPCNNLAKSISSIRTFEYIKQCFACGYFYLTSIPMADNLKRRLKPLPHPYQYVKLYLNLNRYSSYLQMRKERFENGTKRDLIDEMIQKNLFARDVPVVQRLVEFCQENRKDIEAIAKTVSRNYDRRFLLPPDISSTTFCWLCRRFGHTRLDCPKKERRFLRVPELDPYIDSTNFDAQFLELYENDAISPEQSIRHLAIVRELEHSICNGTGLDCELKLFGSTVNSLGSIDSDMDICMTLRDKPNGRDVNCIKVLKKTFVVLNQNERVSDIEPILSARVPIIKFKYDDYAVDLSMYNECAIHNSRLLRTYVSIDARVAQLCYLVKRYARACGIADASRGSLSSYAWNLMVIHFLQHISPPILPVLQATMSSKPVFGVNGWNVWFDENIEANTLMPNDLSLTSLFKEFLLYYSRFDFDQYVISIRTTRVLTKFQKNWTYCMIAIEDPFELTYNLAGSLQDQMAMYILESFPRTYEFICNFQVRARRLSERPTADALRSLFNGRDIMGEDPPNRGCRSCGKIGHRVKDCPVRVFKS